MNERTDILESLIEKSEQYGKTTIELLKLKTLDKSSELVSNMVSWAIVIVFAIIFFLILNIGVAIWLGDIFGRVYWGYFAVAGFYALLTLVFWVFRKQLVKEPVNNAIIEQLLD